VSNLICDLDGVLWTRKSVLRGAREGIQLLNDSKINVIFVTNNSFVPLSELEERIYGLGFEGNCRIVTSPMVAADLLPAESKVFPLAGAGTLVALENMGHRLCDLADQPEYVVVGLRTDFDYQMLTSVSTLVRNGAKLIGTNDDPAYPTEKGLLPGGGAILAAIATASETAPTVCGKPHPPMVSYIKKEFNFLPINYVIGDRIDHDGEFAFQLGARFINVISDASKSNNKDVRSVNNLFEAIEEIINLEDSNEISKL
jgi:HAD superfamily hydrolase (TIGR01450 family)